MYKTEIIFEMFKLQTFLSYPLKDVRYNATAYSTCEVGTLQKKKAAILK